MQELADMEQETTSFTVTLNKILHFEATVLSVPTIRPNSAYFSVKTADDYVINCVVFASNEHTYKFVQDLLPRDTVNIYGYFQQKIYMGEYHFTVNFLETV